MAENYTDTGVEEAPSPELDYHALNAQLNLYDANGHIQFDADRAAARQYFLQHVNQNTVFFHDQLFANIHRQRGMLSTLIVVSAAV